MATTNVDITEKMKLMEKWIESLTLRVKEAEEQRERTEEDTIRKREMLIQSTLTDRIMSVNGD